MSVRTENRSGMREGPRDAPEPGALRVALVCGAAMFTAEFVFQSLTRAAFRLEPRLLLLALAYLIAPLGAAGLGWLAAWWRRSQPAVGARRGVEAWVLLVASCSLAILAYREASIVPEDWRRGVFGITLVGLPCLFHLGIQRRWRLRSSTRACAWTAAFCFSLTVIGLPRALVHLAWNLQYAALIGKLAGGLLLGVLAALLWLGLQAALRHPARAGLIAAVGIGGVVWLTTAAGPRRTSEPARRGDVFLIVLDSLRLDATSLSPASPGATPTLEALARRGTAFVRCSSPSLMTTYSLPALLGLPLDEQPGLRTWSARDEERWCRSLAGQLQSAGYRVHLLIDYMGTAIQGLDAYRWDSIAARPENWFFLTSAPRGLAAIVTGREERILAQMGDRHPFGPAGPAAHLADLLAQDPRPGFFLIHLGVPHSPFNLPPYQAQSLPSPTEAELRESHRRFEKLRGKPDQELVERFRSNYRLAVRAADEQLAALLQVLERADRGRDSLLVVTSDHGEPFGEHGVFGHGRTLHFEGHRVPLVVVGPGFEAGRTVVEPLTSNDLRPTILAWAGLPAPNGRLDAPSPFLVWHPSGVRSEHERWALLWTAVPHLLDRPTAWGHRRELELYDLQDDPAELVDVYPGPPGVVDALLDQLVSSTHLPETMRQRFQRRSQEPGWPPAATVPEAHRQ